MLDFIERYADLRETPAQFQERCAQIALRRFWEGRRHDVELSPLRELESV
jgi:hypothetical protein